ncbi:Alpha/beta hydrolase family-domain-containing protein [Boletus edulis BED1]|uniref:Alpha/beta hydrolase family-domain-containing protein n=1 Tax=Boletus edulis BED1 TaxID=1328754 RepID=A0AAD4C8T9_BOLED|nr:Alpha/beta hydrolase family-domain-containing protein [Boletus edulis BED1]
MTTGSNVVLSRIYVFDPRPRFPFQIVAKRYWIGDCPDGPGVSKTLEDDLTLVFMSGNGTPKEQWEVTIQRLFQHQQAAPRKTVQFHDMWSLEMPNQGDSAVLNEEVLRWGYDIFSWEVYARGVHAFLAGLGTGVDVDFSKRKLALVGHSLGGAVALLVTTYYPLLKISSLHLFEPTLAGESGQDHGYQIAEVVDKQTVVWNSSEDCLQQLGRRAWDKRILKLFVEHGLRPLPTADHPDLKDGVTSKGTKKQLIAAFRDCVSKGVAYRYLPHVLKDIPTHITYGTVADFIPGEWQEDTLHIASGGISNFASVTKVPGAGHMILQTHPDVIGDVLWESVTQPHEWFTKNAVVAKL